MSARRCTKCERPMSRQSAVLVDGQPMHATCGMPDVIAAAPDALKPGTVTQLLYAHDDWCPTLRTNRTEDCGCVPEVSMKAWQ